ncbi:MAG: RDD family protein [Actinocatenispora sp.]
MPSDYRSAGAGRLVNGEAVEVEVRTAGIGSRVLAFLIDVTLQLILALALFMLGLILVLYLSLRGDPHRALVSGLLVIAGVAVFLGYPVAVEMLSGGRSVGKLAMGLRVVREDGGPVRFRHALTRALVGLAVEWPGVLIPPVSWLICLGVMIIHPSGRRLGDLAAGTMVLHERTPALWGWVPTMPPQLRSWAATLDLSGLDDDLALAVRHYLSRNRQIREPARTRLGISLAAEVARQTTPTPPHGTPGWAYLAAVLAERHRRATARLAKRRAVADRIWGTLPGGAGLPVLRDAYPRGTTRVGTGPRPDPDLADRDGAVPADRWVG